MKFRLRVITPLHIGNGEKYSPLEYILENGMLKRYNVERLIAKAEKRKLLNFLAYYFKMQNPRFQKFLSLKDIRSSNPYIKNIVSETEPDYTIKAAGITRESDIEEFIKSKGSIYIPGSEIKGSIRRALLFYVLKEDRRLFSRLVSDLKSLTKIIKSPKKELNRISQRVENTVFRGSKNTQYIKNTAFKRNQDDAQPDILKLLRVSDSNLLQPSGKNLKVERIGVYYITLDERSKHRLKREFLSEVVLPGTQFEFNIDLAVDYKKIARTLNCHPIVRSLFTDFRNEKETILKIIEIWQEAERETIKLDSQLKSDRQGLVRIGKHEGYLFTTVTGLIKNYDKELFSEVFRMSVPRFSVIPNKTRKFTVKDKLPLGFCRVEKI